MTPTAGGNLSRLSYVKLLSISLVCVSQWIILSAVGFNALAKGSVNQNDTFIGTSAGASSQNLTNDVGVGVDALENLLTGSSNIAIGTLAGANYTGSESSNIVIGNAGVVGESRVIRIGSGQTNVIFPSSAIVNFSVISNVPGTNRFYDQIGRLQVDTNFNLFGTFFDGPSLSATEGVYSTNAIYSLGNPSNYIATITGTNTIASSSSSLVLTNQNTIFNYGAGTNGHVGYWFTQSGQSLNGSISYETLVPGFVLFTNNGTSWGVATSNNPVCVGAGIPTAWNYFANNTGQAIYSTATSSTSHQLVVVGSLKPMTR